MRICIFFICFFLLFIGCDKKEMSKTPEPKAKTQTKKIDPKAKEEPIIEEVTEIIPGGYTKQDPQMKEMKEKAVQILKEKYPKWQLVKVIKAGTQVVAGTNYFFRLEITENQTKSVWDLIVYENLKGKMNIIKAVKVK